jgi:hypothetical protein
MAQGAALERSADKDASQAEWMLQRNAGAEWCSLSSTPSGWTLSMHGDEFTVVAERMEAERQGEVEGMRSRLHDLGWADVPPVRLRPKPDRRKI